MYKAILQRVIKDYTYNITLCHVVPGIIHHGESFPPRWGLNPWPSDHESGALLNKLNRSVKGWTNDDEKKVGQ